MTTYSADRLINGEVETVTDTPVDDAVFGDAPTAPSEPTAPTEPGVSEAEPEGALTGEIITGKEIDTKPKWQHEFLEFKGDTLEVRAPSDQALAGFSLASGKYVPMEVKNDIVGLFVQNHISSDSYGRIMQRLMDPDDNVYQPETIGELMRAIVGISMEQKRQAEEAEKAAADAAKSAG